MADFRFEGGLFATIRGSSWEKWGPADLGPSRVQDFDQSGELGFRASKLAAAITPRVSPGPSQG